MRAGLLAALMALAAARVSGQAGDGEIRVEAADPTGLPVAAEVELDCASCPYHGVFRAEAGGRVAVHRLPYGAYRVRVTRAGLSAVERTVEVRSALPVEVKAVLGPEEVRESVSVSSGGGLVDTQAVNSPERIGAEDLSERTAAPPGRGLSSLVLTEPGWVAEANGILHPRESEYQVQYVIDGIPLTDNRSAAYVADLDTESVQEMSVMTAGYPAEFGRKLGGVVEVDTARDARQGFHGRAAGTGGSFQTAGGYAEGQYGWGANTLTMSGAAETTDRYLDPPVTQNYTNHGTLEDFLGHYERDLGPKDRLGIVVRREQARFLVPNEMVQEAAGQRQDRTSHETAAQVSYTHIFSPELLLDLRGMARDITAGFWSNPLSTPMIAGQDRSYREGYGKAAVTGHTGANDWKAGVETDFAGLREALGYQITDASQFAPGTPAAFQFLGRAQDREQGAFAQDTLRAGKWTLSGGLRMDHYSLLVRQTAWSPRAGVAYSVGKELVLRFAYDRVFQTPAFENLLVSSSAAVASLSDQVLRLPVRPSTGDYFQAGFTQGIFGKLRVEGNLYHRAMNNYADDDLLLNTGISFPIAFARAVVYGAEVKVEMPRWGRWSGWASYSNSRGNGFFPVTGGLFLGESAPGAISAGAVSFPVSQDQRNTARARVRYEIGPRVWAAMGAWYDSGLPVDFNGTYEQAAAQYGADILARVNFSDYRTRPAFSLDASVGVLVRKAEKLPVRFQADVTNLTDKLNVINFAGLFSGTALAAPRSVSARMETSF